MIKTYSHRDKKGIELVTNVNSKNNDTAKNSATENYPKSEAKAKKNKNKIQLKIKGFHHMLVRRTNKIRQIQVIYFKIHCSKWFGILQRLFVVKAILS